MSGHGGYRPGAGRKPTIAPARAWGARHHVVTMAGEPVRALEVAPGDYRLALADVISAMQLGEGETKLVIAALERRDFAFVDGVLTVAPTALARFDAGELVTEAVRTGA